MAIHRVKKFLLTRVIRDIQKRVECVDRETVAVGFSQEERYPGSSVTMFAISMALNGTGGDACSMWDCFGYHGGRRKIPDYPMSELTPDRYIQVIHDDGKGPNPGPDVTDDDFR